MDDGHCVMDAADMATEPTGVSSVKPPIQAPAQAPGRQPEWRVFDAVWYLAHYPEVAGRIAQLGLASAERFYWDHGAALGHSPNRFFDETWYLHTYPDIASHVAAGGARCGFDHYIQDGLHGRSPHWLFDEHGYRARNPDLVFSDPSGYLNGYDHYLDAGDAEGRRSHRFFDPALYRSAVVESAGTASSPGGPFRHLLADHYAAGSNARLSWYFDPVWYLRTYPEVAQELKDACWTCALHHYLCNRTPMRFDPQQWFSEAFYGRLYPDALDAVGAGAFRNTYEHFVRFGAAERRQPSETIDLGRHGQTLPVQAAIKSGAYDDAFEHWVAHHDPEAPGDIPIAEAQSKRLYARIADLSLSLLARTRLDFTVRGQPAVSVIMVMHNRFALTMTALASLRSNFAGPIDLVLVDSGSVDQSSRIDRFVTGATHIRFADNVGFVAACAAALARVSAPAVLFLNNDLTLGHAAIDNALKRLTSTRTIGAVGAKCIRTHGVLQEAGSIIWQDGWTAGYLRDADPDRPEANFVRDVDFCSGAFLMLRTDYLKALGGFDDDFRPAYYEETDLCVRLAKAGYRVVYDPQVVVHHVEFGSSDTRSSEKLIAHNHALFVAKHRDWLQYKRPRNERDGLLARRTGATAARILFIEDRMPMRDLGSGFVRSNDLIVCMSRLGYQVGVYPLFPAVMSLFEVAGDFPDDVELFYDRGMDELAGFLAERAGTYDLVWIGRTHNLDRLLPIFETAGGALPDYGLVLDTEAVAAPRSISQAHVLGRPLKSDLPSMLRRELASAAFCQQVIAVNALDAGLIRDAGYGNVAVLGHLQRPVPTALPWGERAGLLFVGALHEEAGPNFDSLVWFAAEVLPHLAGRLPPDARLTIAGHVDPKVDMSRFADDPRIVLLGRVDDLEPLYARHRVFVAPTRFAGGIPFKVHEAAAHGVPVVASELLCRQVGWTDGQEILSGGSGDAAYFAEQIVRLYHDRLLWFAIRDAAIARIRADHDPSDYQARLGAILERVLSARTATE